MEKKFKLGVIGAGFMAYSIVSGVLKANYLLASEIIVSDINAMSLEKFSEKGVIVTTENLDVFSQAEFVLFAVKPQHFKDAVSGINNIELQKSRVPEKDFVERFFGIRKSRLQSLCFFGKTKKQDKKSCSDVAGDMRCGRSPA